jgi:sarcosine/dimethylglycine N-methyltransferase
MSNAYSPVVKTAQAYYNSDDADNFYFHIWGGEDIHIGIYASDDESIAAASERTVASMAERVGGVAAETRVLDIGAGYGGAARWLARRFGWQVACLNLSEAQNARNRELSAAQGLAEHVTVIDGNFESIPAADAAYDLVWSQDAILHSGRRARVLQEIDRVLVPGGEFLFTDPMQADACPAGVLQPVLERIHLDSLGSFAFYRQQAAALGWEEVGIVDLTPQLPTHYARVRRDLEARRRELAGLVSEAYIERMLQGLGHWVEAGNNGYLAWGILHFRKPR